LSKKNDQELVTENQKHDNSTDEKHDNSTDEKPDEVEILGLQKRSSLIEK